jgi:hypothetical protein
LVVKNNGSVFFNYDVWTDTVSINTMWEALRTKSSTVYPIITGINNCRSISQGGFTQIGTNLILINTTIAYGPGDTAQVFPAAAFTVATINDPKYFPTKEVYSTAPALVADGRLLRMVNVSIRPNGEVVIYNYDYTDITYVQINTCYYTNG